MEKIKRQTGNYIVYINKRQMLNKIDKRIDRRYIIKYLDRDKDDSKEINK